MFCPFIIILLFVALLVSMCGLYFLSYVRREGLGWLSKAVGTLSVGFGIFVFFGGIIASITMATCHKGGHHGKHGCMGNKKHCSGESCKSKEEVHSEIKVYTYRNDADTLSKDNKKVVKKEVKIIRE